jgi:hypothetical protein
VFIQLTKEFLGKKVGERIDVAEADAAQLVRQGVAIHVADDPLTPAVAKALESAFARYNQGLDQAIHQALRSYADAQGQSRRIAVPALFGPGGDGDPRKSFGDWALAVARNDRSYLEKHYGRCSTSLYCVHGRGPGPHRLTLKCRRRRRIIHRASCCRAASEVRDRGGAAL